MLKNVVLLAVLFLSGGIAGAQTTHEVEFEGHGGVRLFGTFVSPADAGPSGSPAVLLISGSGPTDRDGNSAMLPTRIDTLAQFADALSKRGVASFRFDKRVSGKSASMIRHDESICDFVAWEAFIGDTRAAFDTMIVRPEVDRTRTAIAGHSEGGLLAMLVATQPDRATPAAVVLMATPGRPLGVVLEAQFVRQMDLQKTPPQKREQIVQNLRTLIDEMRRDQMLTTEPLPVVRSLFPPDHEKFLGPLFGLDPVNLAARLPMPTLILQGEFDNQTTLADDAASLDAALKTRQGTAGELIVIKGASHNFKSVSSAIEIGLFGPIVPDAPAALCDWLDHQLK
jgi:uncharacterized protein